MTERYLHKKQLKQAGKMWQKNMTKKKECKSHKTAETSQNIKKKPKCDKKYTNQRQSGKNGPKK